MSHFSENIKYLRETAGLSQAKFGKGFGVSRDNIASYERGSEPKMEFITKIVNFYHIAIDELFNSDLKVICEEKTDKNDVRENGGYLAANMAGEMAGNSVNSQNNEFDNESQLIINKQMVKMLIDETKELSAENAVLKLENTQLKAQNAQLQDKIEILESKQAKDKELLSNAG